VAAFVLTAVVGVVWVVDYRGGRAELLMPIIYGVLPAAVPLGVAPLPSAGFRPVLIAVFLVEAFLAFWGAWFLLPALVLHPAALFTRRPASARLVARPLIGAVGATLLLLVATEFVVIPPSRAAIVGCIDPRLGEDRGAETNNAIFEATDSTGHFEGASGVDGGVMVELDDWASDAEVARVVARIRAIHGVSRVERGGSGACARSE
jgi:hypothetical protein